MQLSDEKMPIQSSITPGIAFLKDFRFLIWILLIGLQVLQRVQVARSFYPIHRGTKLLAPVVQTFDSAIHRIKIYPVDNAIGFPNTYPVNSDLSGG